MPKIKRGNGKSKKKSLATILVIAGIILIAGLIILFKVLNAGSGVSSALAQCIGQHSNVYVQLGCHFCAQQEQMFGSDWKYINSTDCYYNPGLCNNLSIPGTPTWIIDGKQYPGVQSIETLQQLTGC